MTGYIQETLLKEALQSENFESTVQLQLHTILTLKFCIKGPIVFVQGQIKMPQSKKVHEIL